MKKAIALILVIATFALTFTLASCSKWDDPPAESTTGETTASVKATTAAVTTATPADTTAPNTPITFTTVDETVYVTGADALNLRKEASLESDIVTSLEEGKSVRRVGYSEEWSKVVFDGKECYAKSKYFTTTKPADTTAPAAIVFTDVNEKVFAAYENKTSGTVNLRAEPKSNATATVINIGTELTRTGVYNESADGLGWSRVIYNEKVYYIRNSCLAATNPTIVVTTAAATTTKAP